MSTQYLDQSQLEDATQFIASDPELTPNELAHCLNVTITEERIEQILLEAYAYWFNQQTGRWHIGETAIGEV